jgi:serine protease Do
VTNAHVARGSRLQVELWDGRQFDAKIAARDPRRDLASVQIDASDLAAVAVADSSAIRPGELALAVGNPLGFLGALSTGVVHAVGPVRGIGLQSWVQSDLRLAPGNSGGPLASARGEVIGINTMVAGRLALAIPSNSVASFLSAGSSDGWLGVTVYPVQVPKVKRNEARFGLVLLEVESESPAASASLLPGDILLGTDEKSFTSAEDLYASLAGAGPRLLRLEFLRGDYAQIRRVTVQLGSNVAAGSTKAA